MDDARQRRWPHPRRGVMRLVAAALVAVVAGLTPALPAWADDPPPVVGLTVPDVLKTLADWEPNTPVVFIPPLKELPKGADPASAIATGSRLVTTPAGVFSTVVRRVDVTLGVPAPDLTGLTLAGASDRMLPLDIKTGALPENAAVDWLVVAQRPLAGTPIAFGSLMTVILAAPAVTTPPATFQPTAPGGDTTAGGLGPPALVAAVVGGGSLLAVLAALATASSLRRRRTRRERREHAPERIEVRGYPGQVIGPDLTEPAPGGSIAVRLEPRRDAGTITVDEEVHR